VAGTSSEARAIVRSAGSTRTTVSDATPAAKRLYQAAIKLFSAKGYEATGIRELADAAGLSTSALYHYMGTKQDLLVRIAHDSMARLLRVSRLAVEDLHLPEQQVAALVQVHVSGHAHYRLETLVADNELRALTPENLARTIILRDQYELLWESAIDAGKKSAVFYTHDSDLARLALIAMCTGIARWYSPTGRLSLQSLAVRHVDMALQLLDAHRGGGPLRYVDLDLPEPAFYEALVARIWGNPAEL